MKYTQLLIVFGVFLVAMLLHWFLIRKEYFKVARTNITKDNLQLWLDTQIVSIVDQYKTNYSPEKINSDPNINARAAILGTFLNDLNTNYPSYTNIIQSYDYTKLKNLRLEDLNFITETINIINASPQMMSSLKYRVKDLIKKINTISDKNMKLTLNSLVNKFNKNLDQIISNNFNMYPPVVKPTSTDTYLYIIILIIYTDPTIRSIISKPVPTLQINNLPTAETIAANKLAIARPPPPPVGAPSVRAGTVPAGTVPAGTVPAPAPVGTPVPAPAGTPAPAGIPAPAGTPAPVGTTMQEKNVPVGYNFSDLISQLLRLSPSTDASGNVMTTADLDNMIQGEVSSQLDSRGLTNVKDIVNKTIVDRSTNPVLPKIKPYDKVSSDALQQGSWFRGEKGSSSYAQGQQNSMSGASLASCGTGSQPSSSSWAGTAPSSFSQQQPVDMSEYIKKDSIPCYGCTLK
jgi:hypothetical protein